MNARKVFGILILCVFIAGNLFAQQDKEILFTIADKDTVTKAEFMSMYERNASIAKDDNTIDDYLNLYINYKLKLIQAKELGLDKDSSTIKQVEDYRASIIKPYINDPYVMDSLALQAYDRMHTLVRASHILIGIPANVAPEDTIQYYKKAQMIYQKALKGEDFVALADQYSEDQSVDPKNGNNSHGDLGYFSSMTMIYPFENACFELIDTTTGKLKDSVTFCKTAFGYHIIKVFSVIKAPFTRLNLAHIYIDGKKHTEQEAKDLIYEAYNKIPTLGFDSVVNVYSDDSFSKVHKGVLQNQPPNTLPAEYIDMYFKLPREKVSEPFQTRFGWHIIKILGTEPIPSYEVLKSQIYKRISKDDRGFLAIERFIEKSKEAYGFEVDQTNLTKLSNYVTDDVFSATWQIPEKKAGYTEFKNNFLFSIGDKKYSCQDMMEYIFEHQTKVTPSHIQKYINSQFDNFVNECVVNYASANIGKQYPEVDRAMEEFENGVLIFDLTDKMVWSKSLSDTIGIENYYNAHSSEYLYGERADATIWTLDKSLKADKVMKYIVKNKKKGKSNDEIKDALNKKYSKDGNSKKKVFYTWSRFEKGSSNVIDKNIFANLNNIATIPYSCIDTSSITNKNMVIVVNEILPVSVKPLSACKGLVTSDYQDVLEAEWLQSLKEKYPVKINTQVLNSLK